MMKSEKTTIEAQYVANTVGQALAKGLAELVEKRPHDPIEYLANYLRKFAENKDYALQQQEEQIELERQLKEHEEEMKREEQMKKEEEEIKELEENIRKEKEAEERRKKELEELAKRKEEVANIPPALPSVMEEEENALVEFGDNKLHDLAAQEGANLLEVIKGENVNIAVRNSQFLTARDIAEQNNLADNVKQIDDYVCELIANQDYKTLNELVVNGFKNIQSIVESRFGQADQMNEQDMKSQVEYVYVFLPEIEEKLRKIRDAIENNDSRLVKMLLDRKLLAYARDEQGRTLVAFAIEKTNLDIALFLVEKYPSLAKLSDCQGRFASDYLQAVDKSSLNQEQQKQYERLEARLKLQ